jgi:hypothetical protein
LKEEINGDGIVSKKTNWGKVFRQTINDVLCYFKTTPKVPRPVCINPAARIFIYILMVVTLLFSGLGFYAWIILLMLIIILQFV